MSLRSGHVLWYMHLNLCFSSCLWKTKMRQHFHVWLLHCQNILVFFMFSLLMRGSWWWGEFRAGWFLRHVYRFNWCILSDDDWWTLSKPILSRGCCPEALPNHVFLILSCWIMFAGIGTCPTLPPGVPLDLAMFFHGVHDLYGGFQEADSEDLEEPTFPGPMVTGMPWW